MAFNVPSFYSVKEFAAMFCMSDNYIRNAANRSLGDNHPSNRAKLPEGFAAAWWNSVYIIYLKDEEDAIFTMFNIDPATRLGRYDERRPVPDRA